MHVETNGLLINSLNFKFIILTTFDLHWNGAKKTYQVRKNYKYIQWNILKFTL